MSASSLNKIKLRFPTTGGGQEDGLNIPGMEEFRGEEELSFLAREIIQNSIDVPAGDKPVLVKFTYIEIDKNDIPCIDSIEESLQECANNYKEDIVEEHWIHKALNSLKKNKIGVLKISDEQTTGVSGNDNEKGNWYSLIKSAGSSNKANKTAGGSYGIGKFAPFAISELRSIIYSTLTSDGPAFQGVVRHATHNINIDGKIRKSRGTGYIGYHIDDPEEPQFNAVRTAEEIPKFYRKNTIGTDLYILGCYQKEDSVNKLIKAVLDSFWFAILHEKVIVQVNEKQIIDKNSLDSWMSSIKLENPENFYAFDYYTAYISEEHYVFKEVLKHTGTAELYLLKNDKYNNKVMCTRKTGMTNHIIKKRAVNNFCGVFICTDEDKGNPLLRDMEPPKHNEWDPGRSNKANAQAAYTEIDNWIRECTASIQDIDTSGQVAIKGLDKIGLVKWNYDNSINNKNSEMDDFDKEDSDSDIVPDKPYDNNSSNEISVQIYNSTTKHYEQKNNSGSKGGYEPNYPPRQHEPIAPIPDPNSGPYPGEPFYDSNQESSGTAVDVNGEHKNSNVYGTIALKMRTSKNEDSSYKIILRSNQEGLIDVKFYSSPETGTSDEPLTIKQAFLSDGSYLQITNKGINSLPVNSVSPTIINVSFDTNEEFALQCKGKYHEN